MLCCCHKIFEKLSKSDDPWYCPCCTVVSQNKQIDTLKCKVESLMAELAKTYEYFANKMVQLQNELKWQKDCCRSLENKLESVTVQQSSSSRNKGNSNQCDKRKQTRRDLTAITLAPMQALAPLRMAQLEHILAAIQLTQTLKPPLAFSCL